jgi:surfeit locus 1 family protein
VTKRGIAGALVTLLVAAVCVRLGFWQLHRLAERRASNAELAHAIARPPLALGDDLAAIMRNPEGFVDRRARVTGTYDSAAALVLRGRAFEGAPGVELAAPLRPVGRDTVVIVDRGWVPAPDAASADPGRYPEPGLRTVTGILREMPVIAEGAKPVTLTVDGVPVHTVQRLDLATLRAHSRAPLRPLYLQQLPEPARPDSVLPRRVPIPPMSEGPHLSYAIQWFSFAAIAIIGFLVVVFHRARHPR